MKKLLLLLFVVAAFTFACAGDSPRSAVEGFVTEMGKGNYEKAAKFCTEETGALITMMASMAGENEYSNENFKFKFLREEIDGDKGKVYFTGGGEDDEEDSIDVVKVDGKWKVTISK